MSSEYLLIVCFISYMSLFLVNAEHPDSIEKKLPRKKGRGVQRDYVPKDPALAFRKRGRTPKTADNDPKPTRFILPKTMEPLHPGIPVVPELSVLPPDYNGPIANFNSNFRDPANVPIGSLEDQVLSQENENNHIRTNRNSRVSRSQSFNSNGSEGESSSNLESVQSNFFIEDL